MAKYFKASDYYPDNKDIYDFLDSQTRSINPLLSFLKNRNIFASKLSEKEHLQEYISILYFDWNSANNLVNTIDIRESEPKVKHSKYDIVANPELVHSIAKQVSDIRHELKREVYNIKFNSNEIDIYVTYLDIDTSKTRVIQKREKELIITAAQSDKGWLFRYTDSDRSKQIVKELISKIGENTKQDSIIEQNIDISNITDNHKRVSFFKDTMTKIDGFRLIDVTNIKVEILPKIQRIEDENGNETEEEIENKLKRVVMYGVDLFTTHEFQELVNQGFFISSANWKSDKVDGKGLRVEFSASFNNPIECKDFAYKILGVYHLNESGDLQQTRDKVSEFEKKEYLSLLEASAHAALIAINGDANESI